VRARIGIPSGESSFALSVASRLSFEVVSIAFRRAEADRSFPSPRSFFPGFLSCRNHRLESLILFVQTIFLLFASVYICKESIEHVLLLGHDHDDDFFE